MMRGYAHQLHFDNGYELSIISHELSMGGKHGYFETAVLHGGRLCYSVTAYNHPIGWLSFNEVTPIVDAVRALPPNDRCDHERHDTEDTSSIEDVPDNQGEAT